MWHNKKENKEEKKKPKIHSFIHNPLKINCVMV